MQSGYRYLFEIKHENLVDTVDILSDQTESVINGDVKEGLRNTVVRSRLLGKYIGKARLVDSDYVTSGTWSDIDNYITSNYF